MSEILNTSGEFYSAVFGEKSTGTYIVNGRNVVKRLDAKGE